MKDPWFDYLMVSPQEMALRPRPAACVSTGPSSTVPTTSACWSRSVPEGEGVRSAFVSNRATPFDPRAHNHHKSARVDTCRVARTRATGRVRSDAVPSPENWVFVMTDLDVVAVSTTTSVSNDVDTTALGWL